MTATAQAVAWDHERFGRNIEALATLQPELARRLSDLELPNTVEAARGRDGTPTFRILGQDHRRHWLGRSSMPSISAPALIEHFNLAGANALIPMVGTAIETDLLCKRLPRHVAVFAYDADPMNVKLALYVTDLAGHFADGRLVLLTFDPIEVTLPAFLAAHPGYDFPHRMLVHPAVEKDVFERLRVASEAAASATTECHLQVARTAADALAEADGRRPTMGDRPRVLLLSSDPRPEALATVRQLTAALAELNWPAAVQAPSSPAECHNMARLLLIRDFQPDLILIFNSCAGRLTEFIPPSLPVASWFWSGSAAGAAVEAGHRPEHRMFAATPSLYEQLCQAGVAPERAALLEIGVDTSCYRSVEIPPERRKRLTCDVAILADAVDPTAEAIGFTQDSQRRLWKRIRELTAHRAHEYTSPLASSIVTAAERDTGVKMASQEVREKLVQVVRERLADTAVTGATIAHLQRAGISVKVWGSGWESHEGVGDRVAGPIPDPSGRNAIYQCARTVVFPSFNPAVLQGALEVTAAGALAIYKRPEADVKMLHPQTAGVFDLLPQYGGFAALVSLVREAGVSNGQPASNATKARERVTAEHSLTRRWLAIRDAMRLSA